MKHSTKRMLTTHTGSLARPLGLIETMQLKERGEQYDAVAYAGMVRDAVAEVVDRQVAAAYFGQSLLTAYAEKEAYLKTQ